MIKYFIFTHLPHKTTLKFYFPDSASFLKFIKYFKILLFSIYEQSQQFILCQMVKSTNNQRIQVVS